MWKNPRYKSALIYGLIFLAFLGFARFNLYVMTAFWLLVLVLSTPEIVKLFLTQPTRASKLICLGQGLAFILPLCYVQGDIAPVAFPAAYPGEAVLTFSTLLHCLIGFVLWQLGFFILNFLYSAFLQEANFDAKDFIYGSAGNLYLALPLFSGNLLLFAFRGGWMLLFICLLTPWIADSFAWAIGSRFGKRHICPHLSPGKTLAGVVGSLLATAVVYLLLSFPLQNLGFQLSPLGALVLGLVSSLICQLGDLFASGLKRHRKVKDSGDLIPGHGGMIDRLDSSFFLLPFYLFILLLTFH